MQIPMVTKAFEYAAAPIEVNKAARSEPSRLAGRDDALLENKAAIKAQLARLNHAVGFACKVIKRHTLDRSHRPEAALGSVDLLLNLRLHGRHLLGLADDFHAQGGLIDEGVERHDRQNSAGGAGCADASEMEQFSEHGAAGSRIGGEIGVADHDFVSMAHGAQSKEDFGVQNRIDRFQHFDSRQLRRWPVAASKR